MAGIPTALESNCKSQIHVSPAVTRGIEVVSGPDAGDDVRRALVGESAARVETDKCTKYMAIFLPRWQFPASARPAAWRLSRGGCAPGVVPLHLSSN